MPQSPVQLFSGKDGSVFLYDTNQIYKLRNINAEIDVESLDVTTVGDKDGRVVPGVRRIQGTMDIYYWKPTVGTPSTWLSPAYFINAFGQNGDLSSTLYGDISISMGGGNYLKFRVLMTRLGLGMAANEVSSVSVSFVSDGPITAVVG